MRDQLLRNEDQRHSARAFYENSLDVIVGRSRTISNAKALQGINNSGG
jgi:hypothetical protein